MTRTQIDTPRCGIITKLVVSIDSGETFITYADDTTRAFCPNPSWLNFQNRMMELGPISKPISHDQPNEVAAFLERHFGKNSQLRGSMGSSQSLAKINLDVRNSELNFQEREPVSWHTWLVEKVNFPPTQCATVKEWKDPLVGTRGSCHCSWHLKNCSAWKLIISNKLPDAKCYCLRIKKLMDMANNLVDPEWEKDDLLQDCNTLFPLLTEKVLSATDLLKELNDLLELQKKRNRQYKRLRKSLENQTTVDGVLTP
ncbi:uncharacterized protein LOC108093720 [Drosophila ficusphila]|uniref:uncharacterized protein LOC108093720 n=1 Tax=Drosophila ficusphila TaxID=30025 RepID=UPI0007E6DF05|nr:uncharacterized protein LOC108093720 [Drosophila ficusphila]